MRRRVPIVLLLAISLQSACHAQNLHARAVASTIGGITRDNSGANSASATSASEFEGINIAQAHVSGTPAPTVSLPQKYPLFLGAAAENDVKPVSGVATSIATAYWSDRLTIVSPTDVGKVFFQTTLHGLAIVSVGEVTDPNNRPSAFASGRLEVLSNGTASRYSVKNEISQGSAAYQVSMDSNITATEADYTDPDNKGSKIRYQIGTGKHFDFEILLEARSAANNGSAIANFAKTAFLTGVYLEDGTTPESHGMTLIFESGIPSPNLVVPEPGSAILVGLGLVTVLSVTNLRPPRRLVA